jgi:hypothetical protein
VSCAAWRDAQEPRNNKDAGDHNSDQDPRTGSEKDVCDVHSNFPFSIGFGIQKLGDQFAEFFIRGIGPGVI